MPRSVRLVTLWAAFSAAAFAGTWQGRLIDADRYEHAQNRRAADCDPMVSTTRFAVETSNKIYRLDENGNLLATAALTKAVTRWSDPTAASGPKVMVSIKGTIGRRMLRVETLELQ